MAIKNGMSFYRRFLENNKHYPVLYAIAAGLYPILFYYSNNFTLVNTWIQLGYFIVMFLLLPMALFFIANKLSNLDSFKSRKKYVIPFLNVFVFLFLLKICVYSDFQKKISLAIFVLSYVIALFFYKHIKKIVVIQLLLALIGTFTLINTIVKQYSYSKEWMLQQDNIELAVFKRKPNVYYIQADGYVNFSEIKKGYYKRDNSDFETFLTKGGFKFYNDFRSNYALTLPSNTSSLMMKHHYYNNASEYNEVLNDRDIIITKNSVLDVFKNNNYKTHFLTEMSYFLLNRPEMGYDVCNLSYDDVSYIGRGLEDNIDVILPLNNYIEKKSKQPKFFFIQILAPGHITGRKIDSKGIDGEREQWLKNLDRSNMVITKAIKNIKLSDPEALIVLTADHGGYVGMNHIFEAYNKTQDRDKIYSIFSSTLAIYWPNKIVPNYDEYLKTSVNLFRVIFSFLSKDESYLSNLQSNSSYVILKEGVSKGVYEYIDENGDITLKNIDAN